MAAAASRSPCSTGRGRDRLGAHGRGVGQGGDGDVAEEGLPGRRAARRGLRLAAAQRPDLELLGQQLPAGQAAAELRHPLLERRHHPDDGAACTATSSTWRSATPWSNPVRATMLGTPVDLSRVTVDSYVTAGIADHLCPWQACYRTTQLLGGRQPVHPVDQRPHRLAGQPAGQPEVHLPGRGVHAGRPGDVAVPGRDRAGLVVAGLHDLARGAVRGRRSRRRRRSARSWHRRRGRMSSTSSARPRASTSGR